MIAPGNLLAALDIDKYWAENYPDGPHLLMPEIAALLAGSKLVWLPFRSSHIIASQWYFSTICDEWIDGAMLCPPAPSGIDAAYFGTPTIVNDAALFAGLPGWNKEKARAAARDITEAAIGAGARIIISGLGSGDISPAERIEDIGGGEIVAYKKFDQFEDWIIARCL